MDPVGATHAAAAVIEALRKREQSGAGSAIEMSLHEGGVCFNGPWLLDRQLGQEPACIGNAHPSMAPHGVYPCAGEDQWLALACQDDDAWRALAPMVGMDPCLQLEQRITERSSINAAIEAWTGERDKHTAAQQLQLAGVSAGPVNTVPDMLADEQTMARRFFVAYESFDVPMPGNPVHMRGLDAGEWTRCPRLGEHNLEVLQDWLGYDTGEVDKLVDDGVLLDRPPA